MEYVTVIAAISLLVTFLFFFTLASDILKTIWYRFRGKPYAWQTAKMFNEMDAWWKPLLLAAIIVFGICSFFYDQQRFQDSQLAEVEEMYMDMYEDATEQEECDFCCDYYPAGYGFTIKSGRDEGRTACPDCIYGDYEELLKLTEEYPEILTDSFVVYEATACSGCGNPAPSDLCDSNDERWCVDCIWDALQNKKVDKAFQYYLENER